MVDDHGMNRVKADDEFYKCSAERRAKCTAVIKSDLEAKKIKKSAYYNRRMEVRLYKTL